MAVNELHAQPILFPTYVYSPMSRTNQLLRPIKKKPARARTWINFVLNRNNEVVGQVGLIKHLQPHNMKTIQVAFLTLQNLSEYDYYIGIIGNGSNVISEQIHALIRW